MSSKILHSNKKRDVLLTGEESREVITKISESKTLLYAEWVIGQELVKKIAGLSNPIGDGSILTHFSRPLSFEELDGEPKKYQLTTTYLPGDTLWTEIAKGMETKDVWSVVFQTIILLEHLRRSGVQFTHYDLHVGNISVLKYKTSRKITSPFPDLEFEFETSVAPGIFDYDVSYLDGVIPEGGYYLEMRRVERGVVPSVYDPLFDASLLVGSVIYALREKGGKVKAIYDEFSMDYDASVVGLWMRKNHFSLQDRGYSPLTIVKLPRLKPEDFNKIRTSFIVPTPARSASSSSEQPAGIHEKWCSIAMKAKTECVRRRKDKDFVEILYQLCVMI